MMYLDIAENVATGLLVVWITRGLWMPALEWVRNLGKKH